MSPLEADHQVEEARGDMREQEVSREGVMLVDQAGPSPLPTFSTFQPTCNLISHMHSTILINEGHYLSELIKELCPDLVTRSKSYRGKTGSSSIIMAWLLCLHSKMLATSCISTSKSACVPVSTVNYRSICYATGLHATPSPSYTFTPSN